MIRVLFDHGISHGEGPYAGFNNGEDGTSSFLIPSGRGTGNADTRVGTALRL